MLEFRTTENFREVSFLKFLFHELGKKIKEEAFETIKYYDWIIDKIVMKKKFRNEFAKLLFILFRYP